MLGPLKLYLVRCKELNEGFGLLVARRAMCAGLAISSHVANDGL